ncbi:MAG: PAS domain S-box protein [Novosphingobium sp.]
MADQAAAQLAAILRSSADAIVTVDADRAVLSWSAGAEVMFGHPADYAIGRPIDELISTPSVQERLNKFERASDPANTVNRYETVRMHRDGSPIDVAITISAIRDGNGDLAAMTVIYRDLATERRLETSYNAAQSVFRHLVETSPFGVYVVDADFRLVHVGIGAKKVFENIHPLIGRDMAEILRILWPEPFATEAISHFRHTLATGEPYRSENMMEQRANIDVIEAYDWKVERVTMPDGRHGVVCHFYDLSERIALEAELRDREERMRLAIDGAELGTWTEDLDTGKVEWNDHALRILEIDETADGTLAEIWGNRVHPGDLTWTAELYHNTLSEDVAFQAAHRVILPSRTVKWLDVHVRRLHGADGRASKLSGVFFDISERKRSEEQIRLLLAEVNHRSKNLLAVVQAIAQHTAREPTEKAFAARLAARIMALSASQDLMRVSEREGVDTAALVAAQMSGFVDIMGKRIFSHGPPVQLIPAAAQAIGMALHELATNATKYGALSNDLGEVHIRWDILDGERFIMSWRESGGPPVTPPTKKGFGSLVIFTMIESAMQASVDLDYAPTGILCQINAPLSRVLDSA